MDMENMENKDINIENIGLNKEDIPEIKQDYIFDEDTLKLFEIAMNEEQNWIILLEKMMGKTDNKNNREILRQIRLDDQKHLKLLNEIYFKISKVNKEDYTDSCDDFCQDIGYKNAMLLKIRSVELYRQIYYLFSDLDMKDMLFEIITDKQNHGILFLGLIS